MSLFSKFKLKKFFAMPGFGGPLGGGPTMPQQPVMNQSIAAENTALNQSLQRLTPATPDINSINLNVATAITSFAAINNDFQNFINTNIPATPPATIMGIPTPPEDMVNIVNLYRLSSADFARLTPPDLLDIDTAITTFNTPVFQTRINILLDYFNAVNRVINQIQNTLNDAGNRGRITTSPFLNFLNQTVMAQRANIRNFLDQTLTKIYTLHANNPSSQIAQNANTLYTTLNQFKPYFGAAQTPYQGYTPPNYPQPQQAPTGLQFTPEQLAQIQQMMIQQGWTPPQTPGNQPTWNTPTPQPRPRRNWDPI